MTYKWSGLYRLRKKLGQSVEKDEYTTKCGISKQENKRNGLGRCHSVLEANDFVDSGNDQAFLYRLCDCWV